MAEGYPGTKGGFDFGPLGGDAGGYTPDELTAIGLGSGPAGDVQNPGGSEDPIPGSPVFPEGQI